MSIVLGRREGERREGSLVKIRLPDLEYPDSLISDAGEEEEEKDSSSEGNSMLESDSDMILEE